MICARCKSVILRTETQRRIYPFLLTGKSHKEIAAELNMSLSNIKQHASLIYKQLGVKGRLELLIGANNVHHS